MRQTKRLSMMGLAVAAFVAVAAVPSAFATLPEVLPVPSAKEPIQFTGKAGKVKAETVGGVRIECAKAAGTGEGTSAKLGTFKTKFEECKDSLGFTCTGLADEMGKVSVEGQGHIWYGFLSGKKVAVNVLLPNVTHISCSIILILMSGCSASLIEPINKKSKTGTAKLLQSKGKPDIETVLNEEGKEIKCVLELSKNGGAKEQFAEEATVEVENAKQNGKAIEVEVMA